MPSDAAINRFTSSADKQRGSLASRQCATADVAMAEIVATFSTEVEKSYKCAKGGDQQRLRGRRSTLAGPFQKKVSNGMRIPLADMLAERPDQICGAAGIMPESRLLDAAMRSKPVAEGGHKSWSGGRFLNRLALADPALNEVMVEELHSEVGVIA